MPSSLPPSFLAIPWLFVAFWAKRIIMEIPIKTVTPAQMAEIVAKTKRAPESRRIYRNVVCMAIAFMIQFTAFSGAANLQSSIIAKEGLGTISFAIIYILNIVSCFFLPIIFLRNLGCKKTMAWCFPLYMPFLLAQLHPSIPNMIGAACLVGLGSAPLWVAHSTYITGLAKAYSAMVGTPLDLVTTHFFGITSTITSMCQVWGNIISSTVLSAGKAIVTGWSKHPSDECGIYYISKTFVRHAKPIPSEEKICLLVFIYMIFMASACAVVMSIDKLERFNIQERKNSGKRSYEQFIETVSMWKEPKLLLTIPLAVFIGMMQGFITADFTSAYVSCAWGVEKIGVVMMFYGVFYSFSAISCSWLVKTFGRTSLCISNALLNANILVILTIWLPNSDDVMIFFLLSGMMGFCSGVWSVHMKALFVSLFPGREEVAFSNLGIWEAFGHIISFAYSAYLITWVKLFILYFGLFVSMVGYIMVEIINKSEAAESIISF